MEFFVSTLLANCLVGHNIDDFIIIADESFLRRRIQELQHYRRMGLRTAADIDKYEQDVIKRVRPNMAFC